MAWGFVMFWRLRGAAWLFTGMVSGTAYLSWRAWENWRALKEAWKKEEVKASVADVADAWRLLMELPHGPLITFLLLFLLLVPIACILRLLFR